MHVVKRTYLDKKHWPWSGWWWAEFREHPLPFPSMQEACGCRGKVHSTPHPDGGECSTRETAREHCLFLFIPLLCPGFTANNEDSRSCCWTDLYKYSLAWWWEMRARSELTFYRCLYRRWTKILRRDAHTNENITKLDRGDKVRASVRLRASQEILQFSS